MEMDPRFAAGLDGSDDTGADADTGVLHSTVSLVASHGTSDEEEDALRQQPSELSRLEARVDRLQAQNDELTDQIESLLGIKRRVEEEQLDGTGLQYEGKRAAADPLLLQTRTQQLYVIGAYCADLRRRCSGLTDLSTEASERLAAARRREMSLSTELEQLVMASHYEQAQAQEQEQHEQRVSTSESRTEEAARQIASLQTEVSRLRQGLSVATGGDDQAEVIAGLKQTVAALQAQLEQSQADRHAARLREKSMSQDIAALVKSSSAASNGALTIEAVSPALAQAQDVHAQVEETVKRVLSEAYEQMREIFVPEGSFTGSNVQLAVKGVIRGVLAQEAPGTLTPTPR